MQGFTCENGMTTIMINENYEMNYIVLEVDETANALAFFLKEKSVTFGKSWHYLII